MTSDINCILLNKNALWKLSIYSLYSLATNTYPLTCGALSYLKMLLWGQNSVLQVTCSAWNTVLPTSVCTPAPGRGMGQQQVPLTGSRVPSCEAEPGWMWYMPFPATGGSTGLPIQERVLTMSNEEGKGSLFWRNRTCYLLHIINSYFWEHLKNHEMHKEVNCEGMQACFKQTGSGLSWLA